jgi:hypothetical protein
MLKPMLLVLAFTFLAAGPWSSAVAASKSGADRK